MHTTSNGSTWRRNRHLAVLISLLLFVGLAAVAMPSARATNAATFTGSVSSTGPTWATNTLQVSTPGYVTITLDWDSSATLTLGLQDPSHNWVKWASGHKPEVISWNLATTGPWTLGVSDKAGGAANYTITVADASAPPTCAGDFCGSVGGSSPSTVQYAFTVAQASNLTVILDWDDSTANLNMGLRTPDGRWVKWARSATAKPEDLVWPGAVPGSYVVQVSAASGSANFTLTTYRNGAVPPAPTSGARFLTEFGYGPGNIGHAGLYPYGMKYDPFDNTVLVGDVWNHRVLKFTPTGQQVSGFSIPPAGAPRIEPYDIDVGPDGTIWIAQEAYTRIDHYSADGKTLIRSIGVNGSPGSNYPRGCGNGSMHWSTNIAVHPTNGTFYVSDGFCHDVFQFSQATGAFIRAWNINPAVFGVKSITPRGIDVAPDGNLVLAEHQSDRIAKFDPNGNVLWVSPVVSAMQDPRGDAVDQSTGDIYVVGALTQDVFHFNSSGTLLDTWTKAGATRFDSIRYISAANGELWVSDMYGYRVWHLSGASTGTSSATALTWTTGPQPPPNGGFNQVSGFGVDSSTGVLMAVDTFENRGQVFGLNDPAHPGSLWWCTSASNCPAYQTQFGHRAANGILDSGFNYPRDATVGGGHLWTDGGQSVVEYNEDGTFAGRWGSWGSGAGQFKTGPTGIFVVPDPNSGTPSTSGTVYTTDIGNCRLMLSDYSGNLIATMGSCGTGTNQMVAPWQVWVVGNLAYVIDAATGRVDVWDVTSRSIVRTIGGTFNGIALNQPKGVAVDPSGTWLYIGDSGNKRIVRVNLADTTQRQVVTTGYDTVEGAFSLPRYLAFDSAGNLYVSDFNQHIEAFAVAP